MREGMACLGGEGFPFRADRWGMVRHAAFLPFRAGPAQHSAQQTLVGAALQQQGAVNPAGDIGRAQPNRLGLFRRFFRELRGRAPVSCQTGRAPGADTASRVARGADRCAQIHHRLGIVAGPFRRGQCFGQGREFGLGGGQGRVTIKQARHNPFDIPVHHGFGPLKGNGCDCRRCIGSDPRQRQQIGPGIRKPPVMPDTDRAGTFQQVAGTGVIAQPGPGGHDLVVWRCGKRVNIGPACREPLKIIPDSGHGGLLQHDLGQPDPVWIGPLPTGPRRRANAPGQFARVRVVPFQKIGGQIRFPQFLFLRPNGFAGMARPRH